MRSQTAGWVKGWGGCRGGRGARACLVWVDHSTLVAGWVGLLAGARGLWARWCSKLLASRPTDPPPPLPQFVATLSAQLYQLNTEPELTWYLELTESRARVYVDGSWWWQARGCVGVGLGGVRARLHSARVAVVGR